MLSNQQIAWLEEVILRFGKTDRYGNDNYIANLWQWPPDEKTGIENKSWEAEVRPFIMETAACLLMGCDVSRLSDYLGELVGIGKYLVAIFSDGIVRDHLPDPARMAEFAAKVGLTEAQVQAEVDKVVGDTGTPNFTSYDNIAGEGVTRHAIEEVPSIGIFDGWTADKTVADMMAETQYYTSPYAGIGASIPFANLFSDKMDRLDLVGRNIDAKFSRDGQIRYNLAEEPYLENPITLAREPLRELFPSIFGPLGWYPSTTYSAPSVFTFGLPHQDDPTLIDRPLPYQTWLGKSIQEGLHAFTWESFPFLQGVPITLPAIPPLPGFPTGLPARQLMSDTAWLTVPGSNGMGIANLLKLKEDKKDISLNTPIPWWARNVLGAPATHNVNLRIDDDGKVYMKAGSVSVPAITLPAFPIPGTTFTIPSLSFGSKPLTWQEFQVFPPKTPLTVALSALKPNAPNMTEVFKSILQMPDISNTIKIPDPADPTKTIDQTTTISGNTLAQMLQLANIPDPTDPNKMVAGDTHAKILDKIRVCVCNLQNAGGNEALIEVLQAIEKNISDPNEPIPLSVKRIADALEEENETDTTPIVEAIDRLDESTENGLDEIKKALEDLADAVAKMSVIATATAGENSPILINSPDVTIPKPTVTPAPTPDSSKDCPDCPKLELDLSELKKIREAIEKIDPCCDDSGQWPPEDKEYTDKDKDELCKAIAQLVDWLIEVLDMLSYLWELIFGLAESVGLRQVAVWICTRVGMYALTLGSLGELLLGWWTPAPDDVFYILLALGGGSVLSKALVETLKANRTEIICSAKDAVSLFGLRNAFFSNLNFDKIDWSQFSDEVQLIEDIIPKQGVQGSPVGVKLTKGDVKGGAILLLGKLLLDKVLEKAFDYESLDLSKEDCPCIDTIDA